MKKDKTKKENRENDKKRRPCGVLEKISKRDREA
jgi:hypothetical protein